MSSQPSTDYLAIGHVTVDLSPDGTPTLGGSALYAALTAARFGMRASILTRGNFTRHTGMAEALAQVASEVNIIVQSADQPTVFVNQRSGGLRRQTITSWAGIIDLNGLPPIWRSTQVIHLAPVAQEIDARQAGRLNPDYFGVTPQGWMRNWSHTGNQTVRLGQLRIPSDLLGRIDGIVVSSEEQALAREAVEGVATRGLAAITRGTAGAELIDRGRSTDVLAYPARAVDDTGAGDVFAAVLFLMRANREPVAAAGRLAAAAAAFSVQGHGSSAVPTRAEADAFAQRIDQSIRTRPRAR